VTENESERSVVTHSRRERELAKSQRLILLFCEFLEFFEWVKIPTQKGEKMDFLAGLAIGFIVSYFIVGIALGKIYDKRIKKGLLSDADGVLYECKPFKKDEQ
jgi:hypothetical protein